MDEFRAASLFPEPIRDDRNYNNGKERDDHNRGRFGARGRSRLHAPQTSQASSNDLNLSVRGYQCKFYRDDELARQVEIGTFLVPWFGDDSMRLDRYDVRNLVDDARVLARFKGIYRRPAAMVEVQRLCDIERYCDLRPTADLQKDQLEVELKEEDAKRERMRLEKGETYHQFQFDYPSSTSTEEVVPSPPPMPPVPEPPFRPQFVVPEHMIVPSTSKQAAIIEKTAKFLTENADPQVEMLVRAKQGQNPLFNFLNPGDELYPYYKHLCYLVTSGLLAYVDENDQEESASTEASVPTADDSVLVPPLEVIPVIEKMALHSIKHGSSFETKVLRSNAEDERFAFLRPSHVYHPYYQQRIQKLKSAITTPREATPPPPTSAQTPSATVEQSTASSPGNASLPMPSNIAIPNGIPPDVLAVINKLASYAAQHGSDFEARVLRQNAQDDRFAFLRPWHAYNAYYQSRVQFLQTGGVNPSSPVTAIDNETNEIMDSITTLAPTQADASEATPLIPDDIQRKQKERQLKAQAFLDRLKQSKNPEPLNTKKRRLDNEPNESS